MRITRFYVLLSSLFILSAFAEEPLICDEIEQHKASLLYTSTKEWCDKNYDPSNKEALLLLLREFSNRVEDQKHVRVKYPYPKNFHGFSVPRVIDKFMKDTLDAQRNSGKNVIFAKDRLPRDLYKIGYPWQWTTYIEQNIKEIQARTAGGILRNYELEERSSRFETMVNALIASLSQPLFAGNEAPFTFNDIQKLRDSLFSVYADYSSVKRLDNFYYLDRGLFLQFGARLGDPWALSKAREIIDFSWAHPSNQRILPFRNAVYAIESFYSTDLYLLGEAKKAREQVEQSRIAYQWLDRRAPLRLRKFH